MNLLEKNILNSLEKFKKIVLDSLYLIKNTLLKKLNQHLLIKYLNTFKELFPTKYFLPEPFNLQLFLII